MDRSTNGGGDEGWVGRWTCVRMGVEMRDGWEDGQAYEGGGDEGWWEDGQAYELEVEMRDGWEDEQTYEWGWR